MPFLFGRSEGQSEPKTLDMVLLLQDQSKVRWMGVVTLALSTLSVTFLFLFLPTLPLRCCSLHVTELLATNVGIPINVQVLRA
jgi:hypothetical protein